MFQGASSFNGDISSFDVSKVTDMSQMVRIAHFRIQRSLASLRVKTHSFYFSSF
jgi:surface protein